MGNYDPRCSLIDIKGILNIRDMGGMPLEGGRLFPERVFVRSGTLSESSDDDMAKLKEYGVTTVIDLRSKSELERYGSPAQQDDGIDFHSIPLFLGNPDLEEDPTMVFLRTHLLGDFYVKILEELSGDVIKVLDVLSRCEGCALFHCAHGKDRTGIIAAIIYLLAGASRVDIITNYAFSYENIKWFLDPLIEKREDCMKHTLRSDAVNMEIMLGHLDKNYNGDIREYLRMKGAGDQMITRLMSKF